MYKASMHVSHVVGVAQAAAWSMEGKQLVKEHRRPGGVAGGLRRGSGTQGGGAGVAGGAAGPLQPLLC